MKERGWITPSVYQGMYNGITRKVEPDLFPALERLNMSFYAYNPLAGGLLTGKYTRESAAEVTEGRFNAQSFWGRKYRERYMQDVQFDALEVIREACAREGVTMANASLRWLIHHSQLRAEKGDAVIVGASTAPHFEMNIVPFLESCPLPASVVDAFDRAWEMIEVAGACPPYSRGVSKWRR